MPMSPYQRALKDGLVSDKTDSETGEIGHTPLIGGLGGTTERHARHDMKLIERALINQYPMTPETRARVIDEATAIMTSSDSERNRLMAARVLVMADGLNVKREAIAVKPVQGTTINVVSQNANILAASAIREMFADGTIQGAIETSCLGEPTPFLPSSPSDNGQQRQVEVGPTPTGD